MPGCSLPLVPTEQRAGWAWEPVWMQRLEENPFPLPRITPWLSNLWSDTILTALPWLSLIIQSMYCDLVRVCQTAKCSISEDNRFQWNIHAIWILIFQWNLSHFQNCITLYYDLVMQSADEHVLFVWLFSFILMVFFEGLHLFSVLACYRSLLLVRTITELSPSSHFSKKTSC
jgi:hypothetical protein